ncbi:MAG TPA: DUF6152 family protein [Caulobacteraceae bacterium]|nr:DUF6152 family protein [Caulobacteraceae bacterium]
MNTLQKALVPSVTLTAMLGLAAGPAAAHHSFAMFDKDHPATITGTVKQLNWANPHIALMVYRDVKPGEAPQLWTFESGSPGNLTRAGWMRQSLQPGDKVQVNYQPLRDGGNAGEVNKVTQLATGKVFSPGEK